eukprot:9676552-Prorocentrum_lima.AAC.1
MKSSRCRLRDGLRNGWIVQRRLPIGREKGVGYKVQLVLSTGSDIPSALAAQPCRRSLVRTRQIRGS